MALNLERYRTLRGYTQNQLALKANVSSSYISELERGKYDPSKVIVKLCRALKVSPNELIEGWQVDGSSINNHKL